VPGVTVIELGATVTPLRPVHEVTTSVLLLDVAVPGVVLPVAVTVNV
jgi:hypothetical protein